jgi:hypothetical protein
VVSLALGFVQLWPHSPIVALTWAIGLLIVGFLLVVAIYRSITKRVKMPVARLAGICLMGALLGVGAGFLLRSLTATHGPGTAAVAPMVTGDPPSEGPGGPTASGTIVVPRGGAVITGGAMLSASGTVRNLPSGYHLELFLKIPSVPTYYAAGDPISVITVAAGKWTGAIYIGTQGPCTVYLVEVSPASADLMNTEIPEQSNGYPSITALGATLASVDLTAN